MLYLQYSLLYHGYFQLLRRKEYYIIYVLRLSFDAENSKGAFNC